MDAAVRVVNGWVCHADDANYGRSEHHADDLLKHDCNGLPSKGGQVCPILFHLIFCVDDGDDVFVTG